MNMMTRPLGADPQTAKAGPILEIEDVTLQYVAGGHSVMATYRVSADIHTADRFVLLGPSGCGKSTLLKAIGGFHKPADGEIRLNGKRVVQPGPCLLYTSPSPRDQRGSRMPSSA